MDSSQPVNNLFLLSMLLDKYLITARRKATDTADKLWSWFPEHVVYRPLELISKGNVEDFGPV
ncbi:hypothetical protein STEG23_038262, partial [Scotinomys teguina]